MKLQELFSDESKWTQKTFARDENKADVHLHDSQAKCWCLLGGVYKCYYGSPEKSMFVFQKIAKHLNIDASNIIL